MDGRRQTEKSRVLPEATSSTASKRELDAKNTPGKQIESCAPRRRMAGGTRGGSEDRPVSTPLGRGTGDEERDVHRLGWRMRQGAAEIPPKSFKTYQNAWSVEEDQSDMKRSYFWGYGNGGGHFGSVWWVEGGGGADKLDAVRTIRVRVNDTLVRLHEDIWKCVRHTDSSRRANLSWYREQSTKENTRSRPAVVIVSGRRLRPRSRSPPTNSAAMAARDQRIKSNLRLLVSVASCAILVGNSATRLSGRPPASGMSTWR